MTDDDSHLPRGDDWCDTCQKIGDHYRCYDDRTGVDDEQIAVELHNIERRAA